MAFYVRETSPEELMRWVLACQQNERKTIELITADGLRIDPESLEKIKEMLDKQDEEERWTPSGLKNPNSWRENKTYFFSLFDDLGL